MERFIEQVRKIKNQVDIEAPNASEIMDLAEALIELAEEVEQVRQKAVSAMAEAVCAHSRKGSH